MKNVLWPCEKLSVHFEFLWLGYFFFFSKLCFLICNFSRSSCSVFFSFQPKGKQGTKGQKQIETENRQTLQFYMYIVLCVNVSIIYIKEMQHNTYYQIYALCCTILMCIIYIAYYIHVIFVISDEHLYFCS